MKQLGVVVPIVTPCTLGGKPVLEQLRVVCNDMVKAGCNGFFVLGSSGRGPWFCLRDRIEICKTVADTIGSEKPLMAGCMAAGLDDMIESAKAMADSGAAIAVTAVPMYFTYHTQELESIFLSFADASPLPVIIYDIPDLTGMELNPQLLVKLAAHENIVGLKDSSSNYDDFKQLLNLLDSKAHDFYLMQGKEHLLKDSLFAGASGLVVSLLHIHPKLFVNLYNAVQEDDTETAERMQQAITKIMECVKSCFAQLPQMSTLFHFLNNALNERGVDANIVLAHEGQCPDLIATKAKEALEIAKSALGQS